MAEKSYADRVADLIAIVTSPDFANDSKIVVVDEYHAARLAMAHFGGNILGARRYFLKYGEESVRSLEQARQEFLEGLGIIDLSQIPTERADEFQTIIQEAETGNWNEFDFLTTLNKHCRRFAQQQPIFDNQEET